VISAPSGAGKTTLCEMLIKDFPQVGLSISMTTRPKRPYETDGVHYHFVDKAEFKKRIAQGLFAEHAEVHNHLYGTPKSEIENKFAAGHHVLFDIDVQGAMNLKQQYKERVLLIFIHPPSLEVLHDRLVQRKGDSGASIETRLQNAYNELEWSKSFDYQIVNDDLSQAYRQLREIVTKECL
jgi:guanylate kinase